METRNRCYTYFRIAGNFNPDNVSELLNLVPEKSWKIGDSYRGMILVLRNGKSADA